MTRLGHESGAVLVEFALTLPLLLLLIVGIFDFGRLFQEYAVVTNAAREGARMAVLADSYSEDDIGDRVEAVLRAGGVTMTPDVTVTAGTQDPGDDAPPFSTRQVRVQVDHTFTYLVPFGRMFGTTFGTVPLVAVSEMRTEIFADGE